VRSLLLIPRSVRCLLTPASTARAAASRREAGSRVSPRALRACGPAPSLGERRTTSGSGEDETPRGCACERAHAAPTLCVAREEKGAEEPRPAPAAAPAAAPGESEREWEGGLARAPARRAAARDAAAASAGDAAAAAAAAAAAVRVMPGTAAATAATAAAGARVSGEFASAGVNACGER
jgi:hypothetical protein